MPARRLIEAGVAVAVATDFNPGSAPSYHLPLALTLACTLQRMTPAEALKGATDYAARAVGLEAAVGSLEPGKAADFAVIDAPDVNHWLYHFRPNACVMTVDRRIHAAMAGNDRASFLLVTHARDRPGRSRGSVSCWAAGWARTMPPEAVLLGFPVGRGSPAERRQGRGGRWSPGNPPRALPPCRRPPARAIRDLLGRTRDLGDLEISRNLEADQEASGRGAGSLSRRRARSRLCSAADTRRPTVISWDTPGRGAGGDPQLGRACGRAGAQGRARPFRVAVPPGDRGPIGDRAAAIRWPGFNLSRLPGRTWSSCSGTGRAVWRDDVTRSDRAALPAAASARRWLPSTWMR